MTRRRLSIVLGIIAASWLHCSTTPHMPLLPNTPTRAYVSVGYVHVITSTLDGNPERTVREYARKQAAAYRAQAVVQFVCVSGKDLAFPSDTALECTGIAVRWR